MSTSQIKRALVLPDIHFPVHDRRTLDAIESYMPTVPWDYWIQLGDFMDFDMISTHSRGDLRGNQMRRIDKDYDIANEALDRWQGLMPTAQGIILEGNHDYRIERYIDEHPETEGLLEVASGLRLRDRGIQWIRSWTDGDTLSIGKANFIHGNYTNDHHAKKHLTAYGANIFYGHTHDVQSYSITTKGDEETRVGQSLGCLLDYRQKYMKGRPSKWQQAFAEFFFHPSGMFQYYVTMIFNHRFVAVDGKEYRG